jgi:peptidylprolyl isomerase
VFVPAAAAALLLAACGDDSSSGPSTVPIVTTTIAKGMGELPEVTGAFGAKPTVVPTQMPAPTQLVVKALSEGTGKQVASGDTLLVNYHGSIWETGKVFDNSFDRGQPFLVKIGAGQVITGWDEGLVGQKAGGRVLLAIPPDKGYGPQGQPQAGIKGTDVMVFVVDLVGAYGPTSSAEGTPVDPDPALPAVTAAAGQKPTIATPSGPAPTSLVTKVLLQGAGAELKAGQTAVVQYVGVIWGSGKLFDSSWDRGAVATLSIGGGQVIKGWDEGLVGQKVGSRVLLVVPPDKGYGSQGVPKAGITGTDTLVFVVDLLAAV